MLSAQKVEIDMKVYIMVDFEGVTGMIEWDNYASQTPGNIEKRNRFRKILTNEVNAAIEGVLAAGVKEVLVWDSHGPSNNCNNLYFEDLHPETWVIIGWKGLPEFYPLLDNSFTAGIYIGGHAMEGTPYATLPHTATEVNGKRLGEVGMFAAICGWYDIPMIFISGDKATVNEVKELIPNVHYVITKEAFGPYSAKTRVPKKSQELIRQETEKAILDLRKIQPFKIFPPYRMGKGENEIKGDDLRKLRHEYLNKWAKFGSQDVQPERDRINNMNKQWLKKDSFLVFE
jgi:D-amino peptidase